MEVKVYMHKIYTIILSALFLVGCTKEVEKHYVHDFYTTEVAAVIIHEGIVNPSKTSTITTKYKRADCPECKGTGVIVSGDGIHKQTCPYCEADKPDSPSKPKSIIRRIFGEDGDKCCSHCICDKCECEYSGECLIKKNNGWPVTVCSGDICETYYPLDENFEPYDPFLLLTKEQQNSKMYSEHRSPTKIDLHGNPTK